MKTYSVDPEEKGHSFVGGNTKYLNKMDQEELAILAKNGDPRVTVTETPNVVPAETAVAETQEEPAEPAEDTSATKGRRSGRQAADTDPAA